MTERKVKLDRANKSILLRALGDVYYGQRANGGSAEETGRLILRVNNLPAGGNLTMSAAEYRLAKAALNQLRTQRLAEGGYTDAVDDALARLLAPAMAYIRVPPETLPLALLRPISGGAATAAAAEIIKSCGADSLAGRTAAVMIGSSETTFYVIAVYFGAAKIKNTRWAIPAALCADLAVFLVSAWVCAMLWG